MKLTRLGGLLVALTLLATPALAQDAYDDNYDFDWWGGDYEYQTQQDDGWFDWNFTDENYGNDYGDTGYYDDQYPDYFDAEDDFGYYESDYDWQTDEGWFETWYGDADDDWDLF